MAVSLVFLDTGVPLIPRGAGNGVPDLCTDADPAAVQQKQLM